MLHSCDGVDGCLGRLWIDGQPTGVTVIQDNRDSVAREVRIFLFIATTLDEVVPKYLLAKLSQRRSGLRAQDGLGGRSPFRRPLDLRLGANLAKGGSSGDASCDAPETGPPQAFLWTWGP